MQGAGGDTNLWPRSPGCVRGKLLARDTGREKTNRESEEGCDSPGVVQDKEGTDGHIPSRRQGVTAWELPGQALNPCLPCRVGCGLGCPASQPLLRGALAFPGITHRAHGAQEARVRQLPTQQTS